MRANPLVRRNGDHDGFGDCLVLLIATPVHKPGHQSLPVRLPERGAVIYGKDHVKPWRYSRPRACRK